MVALQLFFCTFLFDKFKAGVKFQMGYSFSLRAFFAISSSR